MERANRKLRLIDEKLGPIVLFLTGLIRKALRIGQKPPLKENVYTVAIMKLAAIGDTVLVSGLIQDLRNWKPDLKIILYVGGSNADYARLLPIVDEVIQLPVSSPLKAIAKIREKKIDLLFNADSWPRLTALLVAFAKARWTVGFRTPGQNRHFADDELVSHVFQKHEIENYRALLQARSIPTGSAPLNPKINLVAKKTNLIVFHMWPGGTKSHLKEWPSDKWRQLISELENNESFEFALSGSPAQKIKNQEWIDSLPSALQRRVQNTAGFPLQASIELLKSARLLVTVDTGILHLAAVLGTPVVSLHGPTHPSRWGGLGPNVFPTTSSHKDAGKLHLGFDYISDENTTATISAEEVLEQTKKALQVLQ